MLLWWTYDSICLIASNMLCQTDSSIFCWALLSQWCGYQYIYFWCSNKPSIHHLNYFTASCLDAISKILIGHLRTVPKVEWEEDWQKILLKQPPPPPRWKQGFKFMEKLKTDSCRGPHCEYLTWFLWTWRTWLGLCKLGCNYIMCW